VAAHAVDLASSPASTRSRAVALVLVLLLVAGSAVVSFSATLLGPSVPAFLPAIYSAALLAYALTAFLFANQFVTSRSPGFAILSIAYAYAFVITIPYLLGYPGVFAPSGLIGYGDSTTAWLYDFEHLGFLGLVLIYGIVDLRAEARGRATFRADRFVAALAAATLVFAVFIIWASLAGLFPTSVADAKPTAFFRSIVAPAVLTLDIVTLVVLALTIRTGKTIPLWMTVVVAAIGLELFLTNAGGARYSVGWYFSRVEVSFAAGLILCVFLYYVNAALLLQANSMQLLAVARDAAQRAATVNEALLRDYEREQRVASSFQRAALPATLPEIPGVAFDGFYEPGQSEALIGGDWFDALRLPDGRVAISIGDVAGSGLDAAVIMANMRQAIRGIAHVHTDPAMILEAADRVLRAEHPDRFVTAFVALFDPMYNSLTYATAGHNRPLVRTPDGSISELAGQGLPLGLRIRGDAQHIVVPVEPGSIFVFYTDGLVESTHDAEEGERRLREVLSDPGVRSNGQLARKIHDGVLQNGSRDDVAILTMVVAEVREQDSIGRWSFTSSDAGAAATTRAQIMGMLQARGVRNEDCVAAEVVYSELIGNCVRYAPGKLEVLLDFTNAAPVLHVLDEGTGFSRFPELPRNLFSESGRGLYIIATLAEEFTVARRPTQGSHARVVLAVRAGTRGSGASL
jgi:serine phosphatase RsbU (regulator of sigma subunit)/anti-sigma regulatory factor (Ser/Thr protein kinase)